MRTSTNYSPVCLKGITSLKVRAIDCSFLRTQLTDTNCLLDYGCALQREILIQGRLYISENHICFHANIFGWITDLAIPIDEVTTLEKKMTAFVIPNAIQVTTRQARYTFASFLSRDTTYDVIYNIWRLQRPDDARSMRSGRGSMDVPTSASALALEATRSASGPPREGGGGGGAVPKKVARRATQCTCGRQGKHYTETAMEATFPGSPEMIHNLMFASGFIKDFMSVEQKLTGTAPLLTSIPKIVLTVLFQISKYPTGHPYPPVRTFSNATCPISSLSTPPWVPNPPNARSTT